MPAEGNRDRQESSATRWSVILNYRTGSAEDRTQALHYVVQRFYRVLQAHLVRRWRVPPNDTDDLIQGFLADRVLERDLLAEADPRRGRLRSFVFRCFENYCRDHFRQQARHADLVAAGEAESESAEPSGAFDAAWAREILTQALCTMREDCEREAAPAVWRVFERQVLRPILLDCEPAAYDALAQELGLRDAAQARNLLVTARRRLFRTVCDVVAQSVGAKADSATVQHELLYLRRVVTTRRDIDLSGAISRELAELTGANEISLANENRLFESLFQPSAPSG